ncbi:hypothetical protein C5167_009823 [Papaver somniferum]|uniref:Uncharacterized protein n=1 Tax=Papaver somniferum TaxID=3469 RepID=A0A4Y7JYF0_PAPSO|nr:hypothetical protein C5167_009823 [Papaver somniferum]
MFVHMATILDTCHTQRDEVASLSGYTVSSDHFGFRRRRVTLGLARYSLRQSSGVSVLDCEYERRKLARVMLIFRSQDLRNERRAWSRELVTRVGTLRWLNTDRVSPGRCWCAQYVDSPAPSWELVALSWRRPGLCDHYSGGHRVRLVSQSNEHLPLLTVEGSRVDVPQFQLSLVSRVS